MTPNCSVNPTAAMAKIEAVTKPNPIAGIRVFISRESAVDALSLKERLDLSSGHRSQQRYVAASRVASKLESTG